MADAESIKASMIEEALKKRIKDSKEHFAKDIQQVVGSIEHYQFVLDQAKKRLAEMKYVEPALPDLGQTPPPTPVAVE